MPKIRQQCKKWKRNCHSFKKLDSFLTKLEYNRYYWTQFQLRLVFFRPPSIVGLSPHGYKTLYKPLIGVSTRLAVLCVSRNTGIVRETSTKERKGDVLLLQLHKYHGKGDKEADRPPPHRQSRSARGERERGVYEDVLRYSMYMCNSYIKCIFLKDISRYV